ncbi:hypothetical protein CHUAL_012880 [Chamberlinius hualienensis]
MSRVISFAKTIRNHWKKSTFAAVCLAYGINYGKYKYEVLQMMRAYCEEAKTFGDVSIGNIVKPRHVTIIMNPAAKNSKGMALYEKYAGPLLHLAGIRVSLIKTEYEGQAKSIIEVMDNTDAVLVAGGDGTLLEVVTGLCKRDDYNSAVNRFPLGIIPIGKANTVAKYLFWNDHKDECRLLAETAMAIIKGNLKPLDVMSIVGEDGKQVYALSSVEWGRFRDIKVKIPKYWYWGGLKTNVAYVFSAFKKQVAPLEANLFYTLPCEGCSKCTVIKSTKAENTIEGHRRWWHAFVPKAGPPLHQASRTTAEPDRSKIINDLCGLWHERQIKTIDLCIETSNNKPNIDTTRPWLRVNVGPENFKTTELISKGWAIDHDNYSSTKNTSDFSEVIDANAVRLETKFPEGTQNWYSIDNEEFEAKPITIEIKPKKIHVFCK